MTTIEIKTTQNVTIEYELATLLERVFAYILDFIIYLFVFWVIILFVNIIAGSFWMQSFGGMIAGLLQVWLFLFYHFVSEVFAKGQSLGKKILGIKVVKLNGQEPGISDILLRVIFQIIDILFSFGILAVMLVSSSKNKQRFGDMAAGTAVIKLKPKTKISLKDILKIDTTENYEPRFPDVKKLDEKDMLLIKQVLHRYKSYRNDSHREAVREVSNKVAILLDIDDDERPRKHVDFLRTLLKDYIVLTR